MVLRSSVKIEHLKDPVAVCERIVREKIALQDLIRHFMRTNPDFVKKSKLIFGGDSTKKKKKISSGGKVGKEEENLLHLQEEEEVLKKIRTMEQFLVAVARARGHLKRGGGCDITRAAVVVLNEIANGKFEYYVTPPNYTPGISSSSSSSSFSFSSSSSSSSSASGNTTMRKKNDTTDTTDTAVITEDEFLDELKLLGGGNQALNLLDGLVDDDHGTEVGDCGNRMIITDGSSSETASNVTGINSNVTGINTSGGGSTVVKVQLTKERRPAFDLDNLQEVKVLNKQQLTNEGVNCDEEME